MPGSWRACRDSLIFRWKPRPPCSNEADRFGSGVLAPLNASGDREGAAWSPDGVTAPAGFRDAYRQYVEGGWPQLGIDAAHGGQGAPQLLVGAVEEIWFGANVALMLCPLLSRGAVEALLLVGASELQKTYLPKMFSGHWSGTMNLTESQAGSDLAAIRMRAVPAGDHYLVSGQKIFISYGDHDLTENIVHLVLARIEGAPAGVKGLSLFLVPKFMPDAQGAPGVRNDVRCVSIEHKLGIHASPTCVLAYGDGGGAVGYLVGEANRGLECMFIMMNCRASGDGLPGNRAGRTRLAAGQRLGAHSRAGPSGGAAWCRASADHPSPRRAAAPVDDARGRRGDARARALHGAAVRPGARAARFGLRRAAQLRGELLIPIVKGWCTEYAFELVSHGLQVHGGMGYIEETGIAQTLRDARITTIYEGTTAIQANDLLGRKLARDDGAAMRALLEEVDAELRDYRAEGDSAALPTVLAGAREALSGLRAATAALLPQIRSAPAGAYAVSVPYLRLCGIVFGGWLMTRAAHIAAARIGAGKDDQAFMRAKLQSARFYAAQVLPQALALSRTVRTGAGAIAEADANLI